MQHATFAQLPKPKKLKDEIRAKVPMERFASQSTGWYEDRLLCSST